MEITLEIQGGSLALGFSSQFRLLQGVPCQLVNVDRAIQLCMCSLKWTVSSLHRPTLSPTYVADCEQPQKRYSLGGFLIRPDVRLQILETATLGTKLFEVLGDELIIALNICTANRSFICRSNTEGERHCLPPSSCASARRSSSNSPSSPERSFNPSLFATARNSSRDFSRCDAQSETAVADGSETLRYENVASATDKNSSQLRSLCDNIQH